MNIKGIIVHCSDSPHRGDTAETIHKWHIDRGFDGIGYHYVILEDGTIQRGRPEYWDGSHAKGYNNTHLGICLMGKEYFTREQFSSLEDLLLILMDRHKIKKESIKGHYEVSSKTCPNFNVKEFLNSIEL